MTWYRRPRYNPYPKNTNSGQVAPPGANLKIFDPAVKFRLEALLANPVVQKDTWNAPFMKGLLDQFNSKGYLSQKQVDCIAKCEVKHDPQVAAAKQTDFDSWKQEYDEEKRENAIKVAKWYKHAHEESKAQREKGIMVAEVPFYYQNTAEKVLGDPNFIPSREAYDKLVNNKFAERYLRNSASGPKFVATDIVQLRSNAIKSYGRHFPHESGLVIHVAEPKRNVAGGYIVTVLPTGTDVMVDVEERWLRKVRG